MAPAYGIYDVAAFTFAAVAAGTKIDAPVSTLDILPTALAAAGAAAPADLELDGHDLMPLLDGSAEATGDGRFVWRNYPTVAVRSGDMKLIKPNQDAPGGFLYDLSTDVREQTDLAGERPEEVANLEAAIEDWRSITVEPAWTRRGPVAYSICNIEPIGFEN